MGDYYDVLSPERTEDEEMFHAVGDSNYNLTLQDILDGYDKDYSGYTTGDPDKVFWVGNKGTKLSERDAAKLAGVDIEVLKKETQNKIKTTLEAINNLLSDAHVTELDSNTSFYRDVNKVSFDVNKERETIAVSVDDSVIGYIDYKKIGNSFKVAVEEIQKGL